MLRFLYRWRYQRAQKVDAYKLPSIHRETGSRPVSLGSYLSQTSVRGRNFDRFDLPRKRRRWLGVAAAVLLALLLGWIILESIAALELFRN
ncbi:MAG: hypothetical protein GVY36_15420 [Verrucomicrobia bacterium]|jgi:hypothetical protein|nr:hypothetical protein [Verrucomicrobiota bacterium]